MSDIETRVVTQIEEFEALEETWNRLLSESPDGGCIYLTYEWIHSWWVQFGRGKQLNILVFSENGSVVGIVPLMRVEYRLGPFKWYALEVIGVVFATNIGLALPEYGDDVAAATLEYLDSGQAGKASSLRLEYIPEDCCLLGLLRLRIAASGRFALLEDAVAIAPYAQLPSTWDDYFMSLSRNMRRNLNKAQNRLRRCDSIERFICGEENLEPYMSRFFDLHEQRWGAIGEHHWFSDTRNRAFYLDVAKRFASRGWLRFFCTEINGDLAHSELRFIYGGKMWSVLVARDLRYSRYSLGHLDNMEAVKYAIENGLREYDLSRGEEPHKMFWAGSSRRILNSYVRRRGLFFGLRFKLLKVVIRFQGVRENGIRTSYRLRAIKRNQRRFRSERGLSGK